MGRASFVAFMPTSSMSGGSFAPIENSPPGIHAIPAGAGVGAFAVLATVGPKPAVVGGAVVDGELPPLAGSAAAAGLASGLALAAEAAPAGTGSAALAGA